MNKKIIIGLLVLVAIVALSVFQFSNLFKNTKSQSQPQIQRIPTKEMSGNIIGIDGNFIFIRGVARSSYQSNSSSPETNIKVMITPDTKLQKKIYIVPKNVKYGVTFTPETKLIDMTVKDLFVGMNVYIRTNEDILSSNKLTATNVLYENLQYQK